MPPVSHLGRRALLAAAASVPPLVAAHGVLPSVSFPDGAAILVAGPDGGLLDRSAEAILPTLARGLPGGTTLRRDNAGGDDGVTGCNQFETRVAPDGTTVLLLPGDAVLAWQVGDPRARFDAGRFIPILAAVSPGVLVSRRKLADATPSAPLRLAASRPDSGDLAGLLALDLLDVPVRPLFGGIDAATNPAAIVRGLDAILLLGPAAPARAALLARDGFMPVMTLDSAADDTAVAHERMFAGVPTVTELYAAIHGQAPSGPRYDACRAVAAAAQLGFMMVLLSPSPAAMVAVWRQAATPVANLRLDMTLLACPAVNRLATPMAADTAALLELRRWLAERLGWQPA